MKTLIIAILILTTFVAVAKPVFTEDEKIEKLLAYIEGLKEVRFIRNGAEHTPQKAASYLRSKLNRDRKKVHSANDFITVVASRSNTSGKPYLIRYSDGTTAELGNLLKAELMKIEARQK